LFHPETLLNSGSLWHFGYSRTPPTRGPSTAFLARVVRRLEETMPDESRPQPDEEAFEFIWANFFPYNLREEVEPVISSSPVWENAHRALTLFIAHQRQQRKDNNVTWHVLGIAVIVFCGLAAALFGR
jgi:hypothetical protein